MKKLTATLLCAIMLLTPLCAVFTASAAVSLGAGDGALKAQWKKASDGGVDYIYFSPVKDGNDKTEYPLVIIIHGKTSGTYNGEQLENSHFARWSSAEYQARFASSGGAYILMPTSPGGDLNAWGSTSHDGKFFNMLDAFIGKHQVDTKKVSIGGWSTGGEGATRLAAAKPERFCALLAMAPYNGISSSQARKLANMPIWIFLCERDSLSVYGTMGKPSWNRIKEETNMASSCRATIFDRFGYYDINHHFVHYAVSDDLLNQPSDCGMKTTDARGNSVAINESSTIITWLDKQSLDNAPESNDSSCGCDCHSDSFFTKLFWSIKCFFWMIFNQSKKTCACGAAHW